MLYDEVFYHMTEDELRNYVKHQGEFVSASDQLNLAYRELADGWKHVVQYMEYSQDCWKKCNNRLSKLHDVEENLNRKYAEYTPRPMCCEDVADS